MRNFHYEMCDTTSRVSFFRPWNTSSDCSTESQIKHEDTDEDTTSEHGNDLSGTNSDYQPLNLLSNFVEQTTTEIDNKNSTYSFGAMNNGRKAKNEDAQSSASNPYGSSLNLESVFLPNLRHYLPHIPYNSEILNDQSSSFLAMDYMSRYAVNLQGEVNLLQQQEMAAKQLKKLRPKKYKCEYCDNAFSNKGQLKGHTRIHTGERPYKCENESCGKTFTRNEELTRHKKIHTGDKPHKCPCCNKCFGRKDHLKKHTKTHEKGNFSYPPYQFPNAIPLIPSHVIPPVQPPYMFPFI